MTVRLLVHSTDANSSEFIKNICHNSEDLPNNVSLSDETRHFAFGRIAIIPPECVSIIIHSRTLLAPKRRLLRSAMYNLRREAFLQSHCVLRRLDRK